MKLYSQGSANGWNEYLTAMNNAGDINALARMRYALQAGMDDLVKIKMNNEKMSLFYVRLLKSVEDTAKKIIRRKHPMPHDLPTIHGIKSKHGNQTTALEAKRKRDRELELFFNNSSF
jgi:hypothetical protein